MHDFAYMYDKELYISGAEKLETEMKLWEVLEVFEHNFF